MSNLSNPLQNLIDAANKSLLKQTGVTDKYQARINDNRTNINSVIFLDVSASMNESVGSLRKIDILRQALERPLLSTEFAIAFNSVPTMIPSLYHIPLPCGNTALHLALIEAQKLRPKQSLVVSDGLPDDPEQCLVVASTLSGIINCLYIGDESNSEAIEFMRRLSMTGCGRSDVCDVRFVMNQQRLAPAIRGLLSSSGM